MAQRFKGGIAVALFSLVGANTIVNRIPQYDDIFKSAAARYGVAVELLYALSAHESNVVASAVGPTNDYGLMQINASNYDGDPQDLIDNPQLNVNLGASIIAGNIQRTGGDVLWAISAYNRGWGTRYNGQTVTHGRLPNGQFPNQAYVDDVVKWVGYFRQRAGKPTDITTVTQAGPGGAGGVIGILVILGAVIGAILMRR